MAESIYGHRAQQRYDARTQVPFYNVWTNMKTRCYNKNVRSYKDYGGRGIKVCDRWLYDAGAFIEDMASTYFNGGTLDRINTNGDYSPENCRWVIMKVQQNNRRSNKLVNYKNRTQTLEQWIQELGLKSSAIRQRIYVMGWSIEEAFEIPKGRRRIVS